MNMWLREGGTDTEDRLRRYSGGGLPDSGKVTWPERRTRDTREARVLGGKTRWTPLTSDWGVVSRAMRTPCLSPRGRLGKHSTPKAGLESSAFKKSRAVFSPRDLNIAVAGRSDTQGLGER